MMSPSTPFCPTLAALEDVRRRVVSQSSSRVDAEMFRNPAMRIVISSFVFSTAGKQPSDNYASDEASRPLDFENCSLSLRDSRRLP